MLQSNQIYYEDCLEGMKKIDNESIDLIICDLPYGMTNCSWDTIIPFDLLWEQYHRIAKKHTPILLFGAEPFATKLRSSNLKNYKYDWYWEKNAPTGFTFAKKQPMRDIEIVSVFCKETPVYYPQGLYKLKQPIAGKERKENSGIYANIKSSHNYFQEYTGYPKNVIKITNRKKGNFHPTQKPVHLLEYLIKTYSKKGDLVLDNCMGSGTTAIACVNLERRYIGFETNQEYFEQSLKRIERNVTQLDLFDE